MGIEYSVDEHEEVPVTGTDKSLEVINSKYIKKQNVILRLKENGINYHVENLKGDPFFEVKTTGPADDNGRILLDIKGKELGGFRQEKICSGKRASLTVKNNGIWAKKSEGKVLCLATVDKPPNMPGNCCNIYIHDPPIFAEDFDPNFKSPGLTIEGDVMLKEFDFMLKTDMGEVIKVAKVVHELADLQEKTESVSVLPPSAYFLQVGRNIDMAFIVLATHAMDQMFYDKGLED